MGGGVFFVLSWADMDNVGGCHQGKEQQLHIRMTVWCLPGGKGWVSEAPDLSLLVTSASDQASYGSTNIPTEFRPPLGPEATRSGHSRVQTVG